MGPVSVGVVGAKDAAKEFVGGVVDYHVGVIKDKIKDMIKGWVEENCLPLLEKGLGEVFPDGVDWISKEAISEKVVELVVGRVEGVIEDAVDNDFAPEKVKEMVEKVRVKSVGGGVREASFVDL